MTIRLGSLLVPLAVLCALGVAQAQDQAAPAPPAAPADGEQAPNPAIAQIRQLFAQGHYRELIETATQALDKLPPGTLAPRLLYWRGLARRRLALLDGAKSDLQQLGDYSISPGKFPPASTLLEQVNTLLALRPSKEYIVKSTDDKKVLYRVYSSEDDEFLHTILADLPQAYKNASTFTGEDTDEIPVFVFNLAHYPDYVKFFSTMSGKPLLSWGQSVTRNGTITLSQRNERNAKGRPSNDPRMVRTLSHETTHQLQADVIGQGMHTHTPTWFTEGIAQICEDTIDSTVYTLNDKNIQRLVNTDAIMPLDKIAGGKDFHDAVTQRKDGVEKGEPYPQGLSMARYLITLLGGNDKLPAFLRSINDKNDFEAALQAATKLTPQEFYANWQKQLPAKAATTAATP